MRVSFRRAARAAALAFAVAAGIAQSAAAQTAICYNCPPEWADWRTQLRVIKDTIGITVPGFDNRRFALNLAGWLTGVLKR